MNPTIERASNTVAAVNDEYVKVIQAAKKRYEKTGNMTMFRRMDQNGRTHFLTIKHNITAYIVENHIEQSRTAYSDLEAVTAFHAGGWECLQP